MLLAKDGEHQRQECGIPRKPDKSWPDQSMVAYAVDAMIQPVPGYIAIDERVALDDRKAKDKIKAKREGSYCDQQEEEFVPPHQIEERLHERRASLRGATC